MVTVDVVGICCSFPQDAGLEVLRNALDKLENKKISTDNLSKMSELFFKKTAAFNLMEISRNKFRGLSLVPTLRLHTHIHLWTKLRLNF